MISGAAQHCKVHPHEINLFKSLLQETEYLDNVDLTDGTSKRSPAIILDGTHGINVDNSSLIFLEKLHQYSCKRKEVVFHAGVKFGDVADGPIIVKLLKLALFIKETLLLFHLTIPSLTYQIGITL